MLAHEERGEPVDGLAVAFARTAAEAMLHRPDSVEDDELPDRAGRGARALGHGDVGGGQPRDPAAAACHEIVHAIDQLFPGIVQPRRAGRDRRAVRDAACAATRSGSPSSPPASPVTTWRATPLDIGLTADQFADAVMAAPRTRPDRYTILEHLVLDEEQSRAKVLELIALTRR